MQEVARRRGAIAGYISIRNVRKGVNLGHRIEERHKADTVQERLTFIYEDEAEVVSNGVLLVDFPEGRGEVKTAQEESYGDCLA